MISRGGTALAVLLIVSAPARAQDTPAPGAQRVTVECADPALKAEAERFFSAELRPENSPADVSEALRKFHQGRSVYLVRVFRDEGHPRGLRVVVIPKPKLSAVEVEGNDSVETSDLISRLGITAGDSVTPDRITQASDRIREYYVSRGFRSASVHTETRALNGPSEIALELKIAEGKPCTLKTVEITVDRNVIPPEDLKNWLSVRAGDRCDFERVEAGARRIVEKLRKRDRLSAAVEEPAFAADKDAETGALTLRVRIGPEIHVSFRGNTLSFERDSLLKDATSLAEEKQFNKGWIEATAVEGIRRFYRSQGYPEARVTAEDLSDETNDERRIVFRIERGPKFRLRGLVLAGVERLDRDDVEHAFWTSAGDAVRGRAYVAEDVDAAAQGILAIYQSRGFLRASVSSPKAETDPRTRDTTVTISVSEGRRSTLSGYVVRGNTVFPAEEIEKWMPIGKGEPINPVLLNQAAEKAAERFRAKGYKFVRVTGPGIEAIPEGPVDYELGIDEGPPVRIGEVLIKGNLHTRDYVIRRELRIREGDLYNPEKLRESRRNLLRLGFFKQIVVEETNFDPSTGREDVVVTVEERKKRSVRIRPGFSTDDGARLAVDLGYVNIAGTGRSATVATQVSRKVRHADIFEHRVVFTYREPVVFRFFQGRLNYIDERSEEQQFDIDRRSVILALDRNWAPWLRSSLQYQLEFRNPFNVQPGVTLSPFDEEAARFGSVSPILDFDFRDDFLNPKKGSFHRIELDLFNDLLASQAEFMQVYLRNTFYIPIYKRIRMVTALRMGFSSTYGKTKQEGIVEIPIEKRFRLGGSASLRGFRRNCVGGLPGDVPEQCSDNIRDQAPGGNAVFNYMTDLLFPLLWGLDLALFTDGGNAYKYNADFNPADIRTSAGVGLRYNTFFGPLRLDVGFKLDRRVAESLYEIHFAVGQF